ncbi:Uncharacterized conserved protein, DUF885 familyt [Sphingomonas laterariae]|uniref:Uncharacterized conserved protein, DUF885 familyt n=1 Tax=Edaphosphingomonas laterariae TaxID=861865 RepID=A0A239H5P8_9SPHN|nr:DUF885 domain-containing protein [Sphingomonas laterariae]SNS76700.1 Uncharacterized conserved protein, DUF885 familyt [Sphingomonas laterariae]
MDNGATRREMLALAAGGPLAATGLAATWHSAPASAKPPPPCPIRAPLDAIADRLLAHTPETAVYNGIPDAQLGGQSARRLDDYSPAGETAWRAALAQAERDIAPIRCGPEDKLAQLRLATASAILANANRSAAVPYGRINAFNFSGHVPYLVTQIAGPHIDTPNAMQAQQALSSPQAVDAWIAKLDSFPAAFKGVIEKVRADEAAGSVPPATLIARTLPVLDAFLAGPEDAHPLIVALRTRMDAARLDAHLRAKAEERAITALRKRARPAFEALRKQMAALLPRGRAEAGLWAQPDGDSLYAANIRALGDSPLSAEEIHALGLSEVARISAEMEALLARRDLTQGSIGARMDALARDPANLFADSDEGRAELLEYVRTLVRAMEKRYDEFLPSALIPHQQLEVRRVPVATEEGAPGGFYDGPSLDGSRPGTYWINLRDMNAVARFRLPTLSYHEGVPGHHTQSCIALGLGEAPLLLRIASFNAYQEGWGLYAERLAAEMGAYKDDPLGDLGRLQDELFRAVRLVVDTGIHAKRWSREQGVQYMRDVTGVAESRVVAEVERYMAWPGQALGYKLGQLRLLDIRERMMKAKGKRFSRRAFHGLVLGNGAMPLDLVEGEALRD